MTETSAPSKTSSIPEMIPEHLRAWAVGRPMIRENHALILNRAADEIERLRAALDLAITQLGDRPSHLNCRFAQETLRAARGLYPLGESPAETGLKHD